jgi:spore germination cell wall hydrolase CwlJ-like protein
MQAAGLAIAGVAMLAALSIPAGARAVAPLLEAEAVDDDAPRVSAAAVVADDIDLPTLVDAVAGMHAAPFDDEMRCLASAVYFEARGESAEGQLAVAQVVLNRARHDRYPASICDVVYARGQFSFTFDGRPDVPDNPGAAWRRAEAIAIIAASESWEDLTDEALYFHATHVSPSWRHSKQATRQIGGHIFYR